MAGYLFRLLQNITGKASGVLVGGNLCTFVPNIGSQADATKGKDLILFVEEVGESMHNIDRHHRRPHRRCHADI